MIDRLPALGRLPCHSHLLPRPVKISNLSSQFPSLKRCFTLSLRKGTQYQ